jgi:glycolate oxidase FAD binding subunit
MTIDSDAFRERIGLLIGQEAVRTQGGTGSWSIDLRAPLAVVTPTTLEQMVEMVKLADGEDFVIAPAGNGSWLHLGNVMERVDMVLRTAKLNRMLEFEPRDLTCSVEAGMSVVDLQKLTGAHGLFLPLDPPAGLKATVGGLAAANRSGPARLRFGTMRDWVLGIEILHADGSLSKAGGKVVKNVSGYDLDKLYVGSLGTLGILTKLNLRLAPIPEARKTLCFAAPSSESVRAFTQELRRRTPLEPAAMVAADPLARAWLPPDAAALPPPAGEGWAVAVRFADVEAAVEWQIGETRRLAAAHGFAEAGDPVGGEAGARLWTALSDFPIPWGKLVIRASFLANHLWVFLDKARVAASEAGVECGVLAHPALGIAFLKLGRPAKAESAVAMIEAMCAAARTSHGNVLIEAAPPAVKLAIDVWGDPPPALEIMRRIKHAYDPKRIFNRGRFAGRI